MFLRMFSRLFSTSFLRMSSRGSERSKEGHQPGSSLRSRTDLLGHLSRVDSGFNASGFSRANSWAPKNSTTAPPRLFPFACRYKKGSAVELESNDMRA